MVAEDAQAVNDESLRQTFVTVFAAAGTLTTILILASLVVWLVRHRG